ncbi:MAG: septation protein A, partial [Pseudomonadota bacterium]
PLVVFFIANARSDLLTATAAFMVATVIALSAGWVLERRIAPLPLVSGIFVLGFGGLTLLIEDTLFIKIKPTVVNLLFASALGGGLLFGRSLLKMLLGSTLQLTEPGWRVLTIRWAAFFVFLAALNEVVWRSFSEEFWAGFKLFGVMPITIGFALSQTPLIMREQIEDEPTPDEQSDDGPASPTPPR